MKQFSKWLLAAIVLVISSSHMVGCSENKPDPTADPNYKDMTDPANMPDTNPKKLDGAE